MLRHLSMCGSKNKELFEQIILNLKVKPLKNNMLIAQH
jgi:hypothetical protein